MPDREKVIEGLNDIHAVACGLGDDECYLNSIGIKQLQTLINDATELLRVQMPRVMTLGEVLATEVVYAEDIDKAEIIPVLVNRRSHDRIVLVRAHLMGGPSHVIYPLICEYGKRWRCWTSRPTDAQRKAVKWE